MKNARLVLESLEDRELLAVTAGVHDAEVAFPAESSPLPTDAGSIVSLSGRGKSPIAGDTGASFTVCLETSRAILSDLTSLTLYIGIDKTGLGVFSASEFDPDTAGFQVADDTLVTVPDLTVTPLFTSNLISNGEYAFYLYAGGEDAPIAGDWYLKAVWFDLSFSGDWTGGVDTVGNGIELVSLYVDFDRNLISPAEVGIGFTAECAEDWTVEAQAYTMTIVPETTGDLVACVSPERVSVQAGCGFFLSGAGSYSSSGKSIDSWFWDYTGTGVAGASGEEVWFSSNKMNFDSGLGIVSLTVADSDGNLSGPVEVNVMRIDVVPSITGNLFSFADDRVLLVEICFDDAAGRAGTFWEIDWGDDTIEEFDCLSNTLSAAHFYGNGASSYFPAARITDTTGKMTGFVRID